MTLTPTTTSTGAAPDPAAALPVGSMPTFAVLALHPGEGAGWHLVGRYVEFDDAVAARIEDVLARLEANDGWLITIEHLIVGPDLDGSVGVWPQTTSLGADPSSDRIPDPYDRSAWRQWLRQTHQVG